MHVLIIDDDETNVTLLHRLLGREGMANVTTQSDSRLVAGQLAEIKPDLVLLDLLMPGVDGLELLSIITRYAAGSYLPVLVLTADTTIRARNQALVMGARDFLTKPLDTHELVLRIANLLETRQLYSVLRRSVSGDGSDEMPERTSVKRQQIETVLIERSIMPVFQPIKNVLTLEPVGYEALSRFPSVHARGPAGWFGDAFDVGLGTDLEHLAVELALPFLELTTPETFLALNLSPASVLLIEDYPFCDLSVCPRIVIELTEHVPVEDYSAIHRALGEIRSHGARLAADDLGAGYAGFRHLIALEPDIIKLDISLVHNIHCSRSQRALVNALLAFARDVGADVVAEGIEEAAELEVLRDLGVPWGQGYFLGVPAPAPATSVSG